MLFSVKVSAKDGINYMSAQSITKQDISTIFKNSTHYNITLTNYQNKNEPSQQIKPMKQKPLITRYPEQNGKDVVLKFRDPLLTEEENDKLKKGKFDIEVMRKKFILNIGHERSVFIKISFKGEKKVVEFTEADNSKKITAKTLKNLEQSQPPNHRNTMNIQPNVMGKQRSATTIEEQNREKVKSMAEKLKIHKTKVNLILPNINISVCDFYESRRREELLNLTLKDLNVEVNSTQEFLTLNLKMNKIQIDNNTLVCEYPVVFSNYEFSSDKRVQVNDILAVNLRLLQDTVTSHMCIDNLEIVLHGFRVDLEEDYLTKLMKIGDKMTKAFSLIGKGAIDNRSLIEHRYFKSQSEINDMTNFRR